MRRRITAITRSCLLRARIHRVPEGHALDPHTADYLYLVQQRKRLSLAASVGRLRPRNILLLPLIGAVVLLKALDLWIANQIIRSLLNEQDLLLRGDPTRTTPR